MVVLTHEKMLSIFDEAKHLHLKKIEFVEDNLIPVNNQYHMMISKDTYQNIL